MDQLSEGKICQQIQQIASVDILDLSREQLIRLHDLKEELLRRHPERIPTPQEDFARAKLFDWSYYRHDLNELLQILKAANLPSVNESILRCYRGRRTRTSDQFNVLNRQQSTIASRHQCNMSNFDLSTLVGDSKVNVELVQFDANHVKEYVMTSLFNDNMVQYQAFINEMKDILYQLRCMFQYFRTKNHSPHVTSYFQPMFTLFLERFRDRLGNDWQHTNGSNLTYSLNLNVQEEDVAESCEIELTGKPDIFVHAGDDLRPENVKFQVELKYPFGTLYHLPGDTAKHQLICELMGHRDNLEMLEDVPISNGSFGVLTDLFRIELGFNFHQNPKHFYMCQSVVDMDNYLNYFALMFCTDNVEKETIFSLVDSTSRHNSSQLFPSKRLASRQTSETEYAKSKTRKLTSSGKRIQVFHFGSEFDEIEDANRDLEQWYAEHFNQRSLTSENLHEDENESCVKVAISIQIDLC